ESRRAARPMPASRWSPSLSGPRCRSVELMLSRTRRSGTGASRPASAIPQMPHISRTSGGRATIACAARSPNAARANLLPAAANPEAEDAPRRGHDHLQIERERAVGDVLEVVSELVLPRVLARDPGLREAGHPGSDDQPLPVLREVVRDLGQKCRSDR